MAFIIGRGGEESYATFLPHSRARGNVGAFADRAQLEPDHRLDHPFAIGEGAEAAVGRGDDAFAVADGAHGFLDAGGDNLRMLDEIAGRLDHAGNEQHVLGQRMLLQRRVFVGVARVGKLDRQGAYFRLVKRRQDLLQRHVVNMRALPVAVADVQAHAVARNAFDAGIDRGDMLLDALDETGIVEIAVHHGAVHGEVGRVDLQDQPDLVDRLIFVLHLARDGVEIIVVRLVVGVEHRRRNDAGRGRGHEALGKRAKFVGDFDEAVRFRR